MPIVQQRRARQLAFIAAAIVTAIGLVSSAGSATGDRTQVVVAMQQEPATLDPVIGTLAVEGDAINLIFDGLFRHDAAGNLVPDLARRVPTQQNGDISRDGRTITYHLVAGARWHDGPAVTSDDVKFTWQAIMNPRNIVVNRTGYEEFARIDTPNPTTVVVHLKRPWAPAIQSLFADYIQGAIVPAHLLRGVADLNHATFNVAPVGSGPYQFVAWHHGSDMTFAANQRYFRGAPKIARIVWHFIPNESAIANGLRAGEIDLADNLGPVSYAQLGSVRGMVPAIGPSLIWEHLTFNTASGPLTDVRVRRALCMGFDVHELYAKVVHGLGDLGVGLQNPKSPWYLRGLTPCPFDPAAAAKLLDAAGWRAGADGTRSRGGKPLQITFGTVAGIADREQTQVLLQAHWRQLGIETILRTFPPSPFFAPQPAGGILYGGKTDVALSAFFMRSLDPSQPNYLSANQLPPSGQNAAYWRNARVTELEDRAAATYDPQTRRPAYDEIQRIVARELPYVTVRWWAAIVMHDTALQGIAPPLVHSTFWNAKDWTYSDTNR